MNKIILAYCRDNADLAAAIEQPLSRLGIPFDHVTDPAGESGSARGQFAAQLHDAGDPVLLLLTDNWLKNRDCVSGGLNLVQTLTRQQRLLVVIADGKNEHGEPVETHIDRMVNAIQYTNYWQSIYLDLSTRQSQVPAVERPAFDENLAVVRDISNEIFELIGAFRESGSVGWHQLLAHDFALFFEKFDLAEWHEQYRRLIAPPAPAPEEKPAQAPVLTGPLAPSPTETASLNWPEDPVAPPAGGPAADASFHHIESAPDEKPATAKDETGTQLAEAETLSSNTSTGTTPASDQEDNISQTIRDAWFWLENGHVARGLEVFQLALEEHPHHTGLRAQYAEAMSQYASQTETPRTTPETATESSPTTSEAKSYELIGDEALAKGDYLFAKFCWDRVTELAPHYPGIYRKLGLLTSEYLRDYRETAIHYLEKALAEQPDDAELRERLATLLQSEPLPVETAPPVEEPAEPALATTSPDRTAEAAAVEPEPAPSEPDLAAADQQQAAEALEEPAAPAERLTVLITGATSGIGLATAALFARHGHRLILTGRRGERLDALQQQLMADFPCDVLTLHFDVRDYAAVREQLENLPEGWRDVDVLLNNAGLAKGLAPIHEGNLDHWETMIDTNLKGLLYVTRCVAPHMVRRRRGHIINLGSSAGKEVYANGNVYCATKFAVDALTRAMRLDLHAHNIRVSQVSPGHVEETEFALTRFDGDAAKAQIYEDFQPLKAGDVAEVIYFIATRPPHVNIQDVWFFGTQQASSTVIDRSGRD